MTLNEDQRYFLSILRAVGCVRRDQVLPLLRISEPDKEEWHAEAMLRRLRYLGLLSRSSEGLICLPEFRDSAPDRERLFALDILLALAPAKLLQVSVQPPYKLCFLLERADGWVDHFAVMPVHLGHEVRVCQLLQAEPRGFVFLLPLERMEQHRQITLARSHYFVLEQGKRLKFYKGGEAGKQPRQ